jgi:hypothetical protein
MGEETHPGVTMRVTKRSIRVSLYPELLAVYRSLVRIRPGEPIFLLGEKSWALRRALEIGQVLRPQRYRRELEKVFELWADHVPCLVSTQGVAPLS